MPRDQVTVDGGQSLRDLLNMIQEECDAIVKAKHGDCKLWGISYAPEYLQGKADGLRAALSLLNSWERAEKI